MTTPAITTKQRITFKQPKSSAKKTVTEVCKEEKNSTKQPKSVLKKNETEESKEEKKSPPAAELQFADSLISDLASDGEILYASATGSGILSRWSGVHWQAMGTDESERMALKWLADNAPARATARTAQACVATACLRANPLPMPQRDPLMTLIPVLDGVVKIHKDKDGAWVTTLEASRRDYGLTHQINCKFDIQPEAPEFIKFLNKIQPNLETQRYLQEYLGYCLTDNTDHQIGQIWLGKKAQNGKSTLAEIHAALHQKVAAMDLQKLSGFQALELIGSSLAYVDECPSGTIDEQTLKKYISGGRCPFERKNRDQISYSPTAKWIISANKIFTITDHSNGFWRRIAIVPFDVRISEEEKDVNLKERIIEKELGGVLHWCIEGLLRLLTRGRVSDMPAEVSALVTEIKTGTSNVNGFIDEEEVFLTDGSDYSSGKKDIHPHYMSEITWTPKTTIYAEYKEYALSTGTSSLSAEKFWARIEDVFDIKLPKKNKANLMDAGLGERERIVPISIRSPKVSGSFQCFADRLLKSTTQMSAARDGVAGAEFVRYLAEKNNR